MLAKFLTVLSRLFIALLTPFANPCIICRPQLAAGLIRDFKVLATELIPLDTAVLIDDIAELIAVFMLLKALVADVTAVLAADFMVFEIALQTVETAICTALRADVEDDLIFDQAVLMLVPIPDIADDTAVFMVFQEVDTAIWTALTAELVLV